MNGEAPEVEETQRVLPSEATQMRVLRAIDRHRRVYGRQLCCKELAEVVHLSQGFTGEALLALRLRKLVLRLQNPSRAHGAGWWVHGITTKGVTHLGELAQKERAARAADPKRNSGDWRIHGRVKRRRSP